MMADPFIFELFKNAVYSLSDEMALTIFRTAYSGVLKGGMDYSTALCDSEGKTIAQGLTQPCHLGSIPTAMNSIMRHHGNAMRPGDVFIMNDPFDGGMHLPDIFIIKPVYYADQRIAFAATVCHHTDVGGRVAGSNAADSTECYQEGLRIPPLKLFDAGRRDDTIWKVIEKNVRVPVLVQGDLRAQLSACHIGETGLFELLRQHGVEAARSYFAEIIDYTERLARAAIHELPDGRFDFEDWLDDDGIDFDVPIRLRVALHKEGDHFYADWDGTSPQVKGALNCTLSFTEAAVYTAVKSVLPRDIPANEGFFRTVTVTAPPGTIANCVLPAATAARALTGFRQLDCCFGALAKMLPDRVCAASDGGNVGVSVGGYREDRSPFVHVDFHCGAWGGRPWADGPQGNANLFSNLSSHSTEVIEADGSLRIRSFEFITDSAGAGKFRGGVSFRRDYELREREGMMQIRNDRCTTFPYGLYGGMAGKPGRNVLNPRTAREQPLPGKVTHTIHRGDVFRYEQAGGGGWGDPLERDPADVLRDARNEYVSSKAALTEYGVVIDTARWAVDAAATAAERACLRQARTRPTLSFVERGPLRASLAAE
jgi:N-methylhydantoinase B